MLNVNFLGKSKIEYNGKDLEEQLGSKAVALICLLVLNKKRYISREKLEAYLWPDSNMEAARYNLRYNLWLIKKNIGPDSKKEPFLYVDNDCCSINRDYDFECDIFDILRFKPEHNNSIESLLRLKYLFRGDLLEGCYFKKCDELNDLIIFERMRCEQCKVKILKHLARLYEEEEDYDKCLEVIEEILEMEPYDEEMVLKTLNIHVKCSRPVAAITYYNNFRKVLASSLGISPSDKLRKKYEEIRSALKDQEAVTDNEKKSSLQPRGTFIENTDIKVISDCIKNIDYFWISDVIGKVLSVSDPDCLRKLSPMEIQDLAYIQRDILKYYNGEEDLILDYKSDKMGVSVINAFIKLLSVVCSKYNVTITVLNKIDMDDISSSVLKYLRRIQLDGLIIIEE